MYKQPLILNRGIMSSQLLRSYSQFSINKMKNRINNYDSFASNEAFQDPRNATTSTTASNPHNQFKNLQEVILNLYLIAKQELSINYKGVVEQIKKLESVLMSKGDTTILQYAEGMAEIRELAENKMADIPLKIKDLLVTPESFRILTCYQTKIVSNRTTTLSVQSIRNKMSSPLHKLSKNDQTSSLSFTQDRTQTRKIHMKNVKTIEQTDFLEGQWPQLQQICLVKKRIQKLISFVKVKAPRLQIIDLSQNQLSSISFLRETYYPQLTTLNLNGNKLCNIKGIEQANLPKLQLLNLAGNNIHDLRPLAQSCLPNLLQLNIGSNKIKQISILAQCEFLKLEILNIDRNQLTNVDQLVDCSFPRLKMLSFAHNRVITLRFISSLKCASLQGLIAHHNKIRLMQPLAQAKLPQMKQIILHNNQISDLYAIKDMNFPKLIGFDLEHNKFNVQTSVGCFSTVGLGYKQAKKKYPFIMF